MKKKTIYQWGLHLILGVSLLSSCTTEFDWDNLGTGIKLDQSLVVPLGEATLSLQDMLNQLGDNTSNMIATEGANIYMTYHDTLDFDFWSVPLIPTTHDVLNKSVTPSPSGNLTVFANIPGVPYQDFPFPNELLDMGVNSDTLTQRIDSIQVNGAVAEVEMWTENMPGADASNLKAYLTFDSHYMRFEEGGQTLEFQPTAFNTTGTVTVPRFAISMLDKVTNKARTNIPVNIVIRVTPGGSNINLTPDSKIYVHLKFKSLDPKAAYGYFNNANLTTQEQEIPLTNLSSLDIPKGLFKLSNPEINFTIFNNEGVDIAANLDYIMAYQNDNPSYTPTYALFGASQTKNTTINIKKANSVIDSETDTTQYKINKDNGRLHLLFEKEELPNALKYKYSLSNANLGGTNFFKPGPKVQVVYDVKVPLQFNDGSYIELNDTIQNLNFGSVLSEDRLEKAAVVLNVTNGLPFGVVMDLYFLDVNGNVITVPDLTTQHTLNAPNVDDEGAVITSQLTQQQIVIEVLKNQLDYIKQAKSLAYKVRVAPQTGKKMYFQSSNTFRVKVGAFAKADTAL